MRREIDRVARLMPGAWLIPRVWHITCRRHFGELSEHVRVSLDASQDHVGARDYSRP
jgi:hypothetical protein